MTDKRFDCFKDKWGSRTITDNGKCIGAETVVKILNELNEENQDLKSSKENRIKRLEEKIQRERIVSTKQHLKWSKEAEMKIKELSEENEALKSDLAHTKVLLKSIENSYSGLLRLVHGFNGDVE